MKNNNSKQILLSVIGIAILVVAVVGVSFAAFSYSKTGTNLNVITTGTITMVYNDEQPTISIENALPMKDATGMVLSGTREKFDFSVAATISGSGTTINYKVTAKKETSTLPDNAVKVYLTKGAVESGSEVAYATTSTPKKVSELSTVTAGDVSGAKAGEYILDSGTFTATKTNQYRLRMWVADDYNGTTDGSTSNAGITSKNYQLRVNVYGKATAQ